VGNTCHIIQANIKLTAIVETMFSCFWNALKLLRFLRKPFIIIHPGCCFKICTSSAIPVKVASFNTYAAPSVAGRLGVHFPIVLVMFKRCPISPSYWGAVLQSHNGDYSTPAPRCGTWISRHPQRSSWHFPPRRVRPSCARPGDQKLGGQLDHSELANDLMF